MTTVRVLSMEQKRDTIRQTILLLSRCKTLVQNAITAYESGLSTGQDIRVLVSQFTSNLATAILVRDDAYALLNIVDDNFPYYIDVSLLSKINDTQIKLDCTDGSDELKVTDHVDALAVFDGNAETMVIIENTEEENDGVIALIYSATAHTPAASVSTLRLAAGSMIGSTTNAKKGKVTLIGITDA